MGDVLDLFPTIGRPQPPQGRPHPTKIFGIDPGDQFSGLAVIGLEPVLTILGFGRPSNHDLFYTAASLDPRIYWVWIESFRLYPHLSKEQWWSEFKTVEVIGVIRYLCRRKSLMFSEVSPAAAKKVLSNEILRDVFNLNPRKIRNQHALDALRVALYGATVGEHESPEDQLEQYHGERARKVIIDGEILRGKLIVPRKE